MKNNKIKMNKNKMNKNKMNNNKNRYTKKNKTNKGGKVLASGGFGCVFSPALKCQGTKEREKNKISKLMIERHATEEYQEITQIKEKLDRIPNYEKYFMLYDINLCRPDKLTETDLNNFTKCTALPKNNITKENINEKLGETMLLNIPNGGIAIDEFLYKNASFVYMREINKSLMELLKNGIIPMNKKNVYHCDIKDSNILVANENNNTILTRLIDWGLSTEYTPFENNQFPSTWRNRPFQFNVPFSVIIFTDFFIEKYTKYKKDVGKIEREQIKTFVMDYILFWMKERGAGHYKFINEIMFVLFSNDVKHKKGESLKAVIETEFTMVYIVDYIVEIIEKFINFRENGTADVREYLDNVFIKNVDLWGFCSTYFPFIELLFNNYDKLNENEMLLFDLVKKLFIYIYSTPTEMNIHEINKILQNMDTIFGKILSATGEGVKQTRKNIKKIKSNISFKKRPKLKNFQNPIFLSRK
jgi:serine/threonine protein kinase